MVFWEGGFSDVLDVRKSKKHRGGDQGARISYFFAGVINE